MKMPLFKKGNKQKHPEKPELSSSQGQSDVALSAMELKSNCVCCKLDGSTTCPKQSKQDKPEVNNKPLICVCSKKDCAKPCLKQSIQDTEIKPKPSICLCSEQHCVENCPKRLIQKTTPPQTERVESFHTSCKKECVSTHEAVDRQSLDCNVPEKLSILQLCNDHLEYFDDPKVRRAFLMGAMTVLLLVIVCYGYSLYKRICTCE